MKEWAQIGGLFIGVAVWMAFTIGVPVFILYAIIHFIMKFW
jgi:hypothetical protein